MFFDVDQVGTGINRLSFTPVYWFSLRVLLCTNSLIHDGAVHKICPSADSPGKGTYLVMINDVSIPVARNQKENLLQRFGWL